MSKLNGWDSETEIFEDFKADRPADCEFIFAAYDQGNYEGEALVLFRSGDKLFEVNGGHCSCCGLEGQWEPEETTVAALRHRVENGRVIFGQELVAALDLEEAQAAQGHSPGSRNTHEELRLLRELEANRRAAVATDDLTDREANRRPFAPDLDRHREGK